MLVATSCTFDLKNLFWKSPRSGKYNWIVSNFFQFYIIYRFCNLRFIFETNDILEKELFGNCTFAQFWMKSAELFSTTLFLNSSQVHINQQPTVYLHPDVTHLFLFSYVYISTWWLWLISNRLIPNMVFAGRYNPRWLGGDLPTLFLAY